MRYVLVLVGLLVASPVSATIYWASPTGDNAAVCSTVDGEDDPGVYATITRAGNCVAAGDTIYLKAGNYTLDSTQRIKTDTDHTAGFPSGLSESQRTTIMGVPGEARPVIMGENGDAEWVLVRGNTTANSRNYIAIKGVTVDYSAMTADNNACQIVLVGSYNLVEDVTLIGSMDAAICDFHNNGVPADHLTIRNVTVTDSGRDGLGYAGYLTGEDTLVEDSYLEGRGYALQFTSSVAGQTANRPTVRRNILKPRTQNYTGGYCSGVASEGVGGKFYDNIIVADLCSGDASGYGIELGYTSGASAEIYNNIIHGFFSGGVHIGAFTAGITATLHNNVFFGNGSGGSPTGTACTLQENAPTVTMTHNAALTGGTTCGTSRITIAALTDITNSASQYWHKATSVGINAGTPVPTRVCVGVCDLGPYEQGVVLAATMSVRTIDAVFKTVDSVGVLPAAGVTGLSVQCTGSDCGTPVVNTANVKVADSSVVAVSVVGIGGTGDCIAGQVWTLTYGVSGNLTDRRLIAGAAQPVAVFVVGAFNGCGGSGTPPPTATHSHYALSEGSGTVANDDTGNGNHGTVSVGVTWVSDTSGTAVSIPTDSTFRSVIHPYGAGVDPASQDFAKCDYVLPDLQWSQKVVASAGGNGSSQRWYDGWYTVGGQPQWGMGVQASGFTTGSEFPVQAKLTLVCMVNDAAADTVTLWVDGVKGVVAGASVKSITSSYALVGNIRSGNDGTFSLNNGGSIVYESWVWNTKPSDADIVALYASLVQAGSAVAGYAQVAYQCQGVYLDDASAVIVYGLISVGCVVVEGGAVAVVVQLDCTLVNCNPTTMVMRYSEDGVNYDQVVPDMVGAAGVGMWGASQEVSLNKGVVSCCLSGSYTPNHGITKLINSESVPVDLSQNASTTIRWIVRVGNIAQQTRYFKVYQSTGVPLAVGYTPSAGVRVDVVSPLGGGLP